MRLVFADTGYWVALLNPRDELHHKATELSKSLNPVHIVTSEMILTEVLNDFSKRGDYLRKVATELIDNIYENPNITVISQTSQQFQQGLELYKNRLDKNWSLTDCVSFKIMEQMSIYEAFAYDKHFEQAGFRALLRN
ncbi:MAG: type II toxin-antitoxin system VapC family toxin [Waterburya sp.]